MIRHKHTIKEVYSVEDNGNTVTAHFKFSCYGCTTESTREFLKEEWNDIIENGYFYA